MAKNDYDVLVCRILAYLYGCLKASEKPDWDYLEDKRVFPADEPYMTYIYEHLIKDGLIEGLVIVPRIGKITFKEAPQIAISPKGIDYLQNNSNMKKAIEFLKEIKAIVPGL